ncbi:TPA: hypothetical protein PEQ37_002735 [Staphylococcus aureus]|nr:hypothetical protein [Staphylococcus aureus]
MEKDNYDFFFINKSSYVWININWCHRNSSVPVANVEAKAAEFNPKVDKLLKFEVSKK